ncbi:EmrB/QacA subfamily drug resistance transporter [Actinokineospora baliensis]|uniref:DHA2 family efflux MFS transporter permease subunit n=1 Tax=Actinokineospora baliensis TaxID=547056 RepID=UPI001EF8AE34|nr:DHA2 family efflux MFS transporter permease subunit [Actinokineospora baliensis]MBM7774068.1 EmrB/QacA subfamily drug resistance transporter [Actinokineospora baliensis]
MATTTKGETARDHDDSGAVPASVWRTAFLLAFGSLMAGLDTSLVNVGLDTIGTRLDAPLSTAQWVNSGYLLALAAALPACGWLSKRIGAGRLWLWALAGFTVASGLCAVAPDIIWLVVGRVVQGVAGGLLIPAGMTILGQVAGKRRMGRVIAISSVPSILAPAFGPVLGAVLIANLSWHWLFLINLPIGLLGLLLALRHLPRGERDQAGRLDLVALGLVVIGLPMTVYALTEISGSSSGPRAWIPLVIGLVALGTFGWRSLRSEEPLMDLRLVANRQFTAASAEVFFAGASLFGGLVVMPLYFQLQLGADIVDVGLLLMAFSIGAAATFPAAGWLADRFGGGVVAVVGLVLTVATTMAMALLPAQPDLVLVEALQVLRGIGMALAGSPGVSSALASVEQRQLPDASAQVNILSRVGGALGSALFVVILSDGATDPAAFRETFCWLTGASLVALASAVWLTREQRAAAR